VEQPLRLYQKIEVADGRSFGYREWMINLQDQEPIARSATRECYLHPGNPDKVIKIVRAAPVFWKRDANWQEWRHYRYLQKRHGYLDYIPECYGFGETSRRRGLVLDCIRDYDGRISARLDKVLKEPEGYDLAAILEALEQLCRMIIEKNVQLFDLNAFNILIQILSKGMYHPTITDIKGRFNNYELIPVSSYIPFFSRRKLARRCRRLIDRVRAVSSGGG
jgi:hypothetical protein